jgi:methionyl-tRNA formyltransferase
VRIVFAGTPEFAAKHLQALIDAKMDVVAVYTQPDRPAGRGKKPQASDVKKLAQEHDLPVCQPENFKHADAIGELESWNADIMVVVAYGIILPKAVLETPTHGCVNVHGSILPKWRGAAPIQRSIWAGDKQTGVTIMQMDEGLDTGPMLLVNTVDILSDDTSATLYAKLAESGPAALVYALANYTTLKPIVQNNDDATYAKKLSKEEACIDWQLDAEQLERNCRAFNPWPVQWFNVNDTAVKVWSSKVVGDTTAQHAPGTIISADKDGIVVACAKGALCLTHLQVPGKKPMSVADILNSKADWFITGAKL